MMMDLDESIRSMYFAPVPLIVLSSIRSIKMISKSAEKLLGFRNIHCAGQNMERYVVPTSRIPLRSALHLATEGTSAFHNEDPILTQIDLYNPDVPSSNISAQLSVSAWYPSDPIFDDSDKISPPSNNHTRVSHEALYTISILPSTTIGLQNSLPSEGREDITNVLKESIFHCLENGIIALSKDGKTEVRNQSFDRICSISTAFAQQVKDLKDKYNGVGLGEINSGVITAVEENIVIWQVKDGDFYQPMESGEWPIFKAAFQGQTFPPVTLGLESKVTGERSFVELIAKPIRDKGGFGEHIGGVVSLRDVTAELRKQKLEAELQGDAHFRQMIEKLPQLLWIAGPTGSVDWYSPSFTDYTGFSNEEMQGAGWAIMIQEDDLADISQKWSAAIRTGNMFETAVRIKGHTGEERWYLSRGMPLTDKETGKVVRWFGTCTDIDEQVKALSASRETQIQLQSVVNHAAVTLLAIDGEGIITMAEGPGIRELVAMTKAATVDGNDDTTMHYDDDKPSSRPKLNIIGQSIYHIWSDAEIRESVNNAMQGKTIIDEVESNEKWFRNSYTPLRAHQNNFLYRNGGIDHSQEKELNTSEGPIVGVVIASMDVTDRKEAQKRMEETLLEKTRALTAEGAAREASRLKSEFLANMSHEIRTPIAGIIGLTELLLDEQSLSSKQNDFAQTIQRSAEGLLTVINDVLDFSKVEVGKLELENIPFNLSVLLRDLIRLLTFTTKRKGLDLQLVYDHEYKEELMGDLCRLRQVITNLLTNAIKFTERGQIILKITILSVGSDVLEIRFNVIDTGCGINPEVLARLFQPFSQADASTARRFGGTGLGLSIAKNLVGLMGGKIGLESVEGKGSDAWFTVPFQRVENLKGISSNTSSPFEGIEANKSAGGILVPRPRKDIWILIAEDNQINATIASQNVRKMGFNCTIANNGKEAIEQLSKQRYDLVLMDCQMPVCDGYEATKMIRRSNDDRIRSLPIIALTASAIKGDRERAIDAGMVDYLAKPVKRPALEGAISKWLFDNTARQSLAAFDQLGIDEDCLVPKKRLSISD